MSIISAGNTSTTSLVHTGDVTGNLVFQTNGNVVAATFDTNQNATFANNVTVTGVLNANIAGNGSTLTNINASNITSGTISNAYTTANASNVASTIVARDENGSFAANVVTAVSGSFTNVSGNGVALTAINASNITSGTLNNARTSAASANGASTIVSRDADGSFAANVVTATSGSFTNVSGNGAAISGINASNISSGTISNTHTTASAADSANTIVLRDANGSFVANAVTANSGSFTTISGNGATITGINASSISSGTIGNVYTTASSTNGANTIVSRDTNGSFVANVGTFTTLSGNLTGNVSLTTGTITTNASNSTDITNKAYVDGLFSTGISYHAPVRVESPTNLTVTYNQPNGAGNGVGATLTNAGTQAALVIDGVTLSVNDRVLVYTQTNQVQNGVYTVTNVGSGSTNWVMTRSTDTNTYGLASPNALGQGDAFFVQQGNTGAGETYVCNTPGTITFGTTNITFAQTSTSQIYAAGTGLNLSNLTFSLANTTVTPATYGNDGAVAQVTVNAQGQITTASNVSINASSISVGTLDNARTTASSSNGASTIVARDSNGSFAANVISASVFSGVNASAINVGILGAQYGGTGQANLTANNVILGNGASAVQLVAPGTNGNVLTSNGTTWVSTAPTGGVTSITGTANQIIASSSTGAVTLSTPQSINTASSVQFGSFGVGTAASGTTGEIRATNNITSFYSSDERLKDNVKVITDALEKVQAIRGVEFDWNNLKEPEDGYFVRKHDVGVIAQEVEKVLPEVVGTREDGIKAVKYDRIVPLLIEAIKELKAEVDALKGR